MDRTASILLLRSKLLHPPAGDTPDEDFVRVLEADAAALGWQFAADLRAAVARIPTGIRTSWGDWLLGALIDDAGGGRPYVPLFRGFPHTTPADTDRLYVDRMFAAILQQADAPCVLCGTTGSVQPVSPCGHLVCGRCFDAAEYTACPICRRRLDPLDPFLSMPRPQQHRPSGRPVRLRRLRLGGDVAADSASLRDELTSRLSPLSADERADLEVLIDATTEPGELGWIPAEVPARQSLAVVTARALTNAGGPLTPAFLDRLAGRWDTATDVARTLWTHSGGDPSLTLPTRPDRRGDTGTDSDRVSWHRAILERWRPPDEPVQTVATVKVGPLPRSLRRTVLARLDELPMPTVIEDVLRHSTIWKRLAERLHPYEYALAYPRAAVIFTVLRDSRHAPESAAGKAVLTAVAAGWVRLVRDRGGIGARVLTFAARVEELLASGDIAGAIELLGERPGELLRRTDRLARGQPPDPDRDGTLVDSVARAASSASPRVAFAAAASLSGRDLARRDATAFRTELARAPVGAQAGRSGQAARAGGALVATQPADRGSWLRDRRFGRRSQPREPEIITEPARVFFPSGSTSVTWSRPDDRPLLPEGLPDRLVTAIEDSLVARAARCSRFDIAVIDAGLRDIPIPAGTQTTSGSSRTLPRGSRIRLPSVDAATLRLFLHWTEPPRVRTDLDLSVVFFDEAWQRLGHCDYTRMRTELGAVHSGDLTSAPAPLGATEFIDLDVAALLGNGVSWVAPVVYSFNDVPFENLPDAVAGFGLPADDSHFDPARVLIRYDLRGNSRASLPLVANLATGTLRWLDMHLPSRGYAHSVGTRGDTLARTAWELETLYAGGSRANAYTLAITHARGRADQIVVRHRSDGADAVAYTDPDGAPVTAPEFTGRSVLWVSAGELVTDLDLADGSLLISATSGDPDATGSLTDLLTALEAPEVVK